jgi:hypothetical protein
VQEPEVTADLNGEAVDDYLESNDLDDSWQADSQDHPLETLTLVSSDDLAACSFLTTQYSDPIKE